MNNRGWKTLARALVLAHTGMRPSQMMRLDPDLHIRSYLDEEVPMVEVPSGKGGKTHWKPLSAGRSAEASLDYTTLRDWALRGHLPVIRAPQSRRIWFDRKDLDRIVDQWKERLS